MKNANASTQLFSLGLSNGELTEATRKVFRFISSYFRTTNNTPTIRQIMQYLGFQSTNGVYKHLKKLEALGMITKGEGGKIQLPLAQTPQFAGVATAGFDSPVKEHNLHITSLEKFLIPRPDRTFMLKVEGNSMVEAGVQNGDYVLVEKGRQYYPGDMVVISTGEGYMVKYYAVENGKVYARSANTEYEDAAFQEGWEIFGVVTSMVRKMV